MKTIDYRYGTSLAPLLRRHAGDMVRAITPRKALNGALFILDYLTKPLVARARPLYIKIEATNHCDQRCDRCATLTDRPKGYMNFDDYRAVVDLVKPYCMRIGLYGQGESFLHPRIFDMIAYAERNRCPVHISTNLKSVTPDKAPLLLDSSLSRLVVCIDGATQETHAKYRRGSDLDQVMENLRAITRLKAKRRARKPSVEVQTIVFDHNRDEIDAVGRMAREAGAGVHTIRHNVFGTAQPKSPKRSCMYLWGALFVTWDGKVYPCEEMCLDPVNPYVTVGQIAAGKRHWNNNGLVHARYVVTHGTHSLIPTGIRCERCLHFVDTAGSVAAKARGQANHAP